MSTPLGTTAVRDARAPSPQASSSSCADITMLTSKRGRHRRFVARELGASRCRNCRASGRGSTWARRSISIDSMLWWVRTVGDRRRPETNWLRAMVSTWTMSNGAVAQRVGHACAERCRAVRDQLNGVGEHGAQSPAPQRRAAGDAFGQSGKYSTSRRTAEHAPALVERRRASAARRDERTPAVHVRRRPSSRSML